MPISYRVDADRGVVFTTWDGDVTIDDQVQHWRRLLADPAALAARRSIVDVRAGRPLFTGAEMRTALHDVAMPKLRTHPWITAIVVGNAVQFGVSRQFEMIASQVTSGSVFEDPDEALAWVMAQNSSTDGG